MVGAGIGFVGGGGTGAALAVVTGGLASPAIPAGAWQGAAVGSAGGLAVGKAITSALFDDGNTMQMAQAGRGRGANQGPNEEANRIASEHGLNRAGQRQLHDRITGRDLTPDEIADEAAEVAKHKKWVK